MVFLKLVNNGPVQKTMTFLHFFYIFFFWLTSGKKLHARNRLNFYLQKNTGLLGNYVAL